MKNFLITLLVSVPTIVSAQCSSTFVVAPVNTFEDVFTYEVDQIFNDVCHQAVQPVTVDRFTMNDITSVRSTFIITVTEGQNIIDKFVINPGPNVNGCRSWVTSSLESSLATLTIE